MYMYVCVIHPQYNRTTLISALSLVRQKFEDGKDNTLFKALLSHVGTLFVKRCEMSHNR